MPSRPATNEDTPNQVIQELDRQLAKWLALLSKQLLDTKAHVVPDYLSEREIRHAANKIPRQYGWTIAASEALKRYYRQLGGDLAKRANDSLNELVDYAFSHKNLSGFAWNQLNKADGAATEFRSAIQAATPSSLRYEDEQSPEYKDMLRREKQEEEYLYHRVPGRPRKILFPHHDVEATAGPVFPQQRTISPAVVIDLSGSRFAEASLREVRNMFDQALATYDGTKSIKPWGQRRTKNTSKVRILLQTTEDEETLRKDQDWLQEFPGAHLCSGQWYPVKVKGVERAALFDHPESTSLRENVARDISKDNAVSVERIRWLSKHSEKQYGSAVIHFTRKSEADAVLQRGSVEIYNMTVFTAVFEDRDRYRCFNCLEYGHHSRQCQNERRCRNCSLPGHIAKDCQVQSIRCISCGGSLSHNYPSGNGVNV